MPLSPEQQAEVDALSSASQPTRRATVPALEEILYAPIPVLDHGFVRVIDYMGDDAAIVQAARVSYGKGTKKVSEDKGLINYLLRHRHSTPSSSSHASPGTAHSRSNTPSATNRWNHRCTVASEPNSRGRWPRRTPDRMR